MQFDSRGKKIILASRKLGAEPKDGDNFAKYFGTNVTGVKAAQD